MNFWHPNQVPVLNEHQTNIQIEDAVPVPSLGELTNASVSGLTTASPKPKGFMPCFREFQEHQRGLVGIFVTSAERWAPCWLWVIFGNSKIAGPRMFQSRKSWHIYPYHLLTLTIHRILFCAYLIFDVPTPKNKPKVGQNGPVAEPSRRRPQSWDRSHRQRPVCCSPILHAHRPDDGHWETCFWMFFWMAMTFFVGCLVRIYLFLGILFQGKSDSISETHRNTFYHLISLYLHE